MDKPAPLGDLNTVTGPEGEQGTSGQLGFVGKLFKGAAGLFFDGKSKTVSKSVGEFDGEGEIEMASKRRKEAAPEGPIVGGKPLPGVVPGAAGATGLPAFPSRSGDGHGNAENGAQLVDLVKQPDTGYKPLLDVPRGQPNEPTPKPPEANLPDMNVHGFPR